MGFNYLLEAAVGLCEVGALTRRHRENHLTGGLDIRPRLLGGARRFFIAQPQPFQPVPQRRDADGYVQLRQTSLLEFPQRQIRLRPNPAAQGAVMLFQAGTAVTADLLGAAAAGEPVLLLKPLHTFTADPKPPAHFAGALTPFARRDNPLAQVLTQRPHEFPFMPRV